MQLWSYELISEAEVLLRITDFSVWIVFASLDERQSLENQRIPTSEWQEIPFESEEGVTPLPIEASDLEQIAQAMKDTFFPKHE